MPSPCQMSPLARARLEGALAYAPMPLFWLRRPHVPLLVLLLTLIAFYPLIERSLAGRWAFNLLVVVGVLFSLHRIRASRAGIAFAVATGALARGGELVRALLTSA